MLSSSACSRQQARTIGNRVQACPCCGSVTQSSCHESCSVRYGQRLAELKRLQDTAYGYYWRCWDDCTARGDNNCVAECESLYDEYLAYDHPIDEYSRLYEDCIDDCEYR